MRRTILHCVPAMLALSLSAGAAHAAMLANADAEDHYVIVTENGERAEIVVPAGKEVEVCSSGCFLSFPSGDIMALKGQEKVMIEKGAGRLVSR